MFPCLSVACLQVFSLFWGGVSAGVSLFVGGVSAGVFLFVSAGVSLF